MHQLFRIFFAAFILLSVGFNGVTGAAAQRRIYVNEYLNIGVGARGLAMGGAQSASTRDVTSAYWNPAGLTQIKDDFQVGLMHAEYFAGNAKYDYAAAAMPLKGGNRSIGISALRFAIDDIPNTLDYIQPDGSFDETKLKSLTAGDYAFLISYAQGVKLFKNPNVQTSIGANVKVIYRHLGSMANAWGGGVDLGMQIRGPRWRFGAMLKDITTTYTAWSFHLTEQEKEVFGKTGNEIPIKSYEVMLPRFNLGIARSLLKPGKKLGLMAELGADITTDGERGTILHSGTLSVDPKAGLEASYNNVVFLRLGVGNFQRVGNDGDTTGQKKYTLYQPSAGIGLKLGPLVVDYAYTSLQTQSNSLFSHIVSLRLDINRTARKKEATAPAPEASKS